MASFQLGSSPAPILRTPIPRHLNTADSSTQATSDTDSYSDEEDNLPYPAPLPRTSFLTPSFNPSTYLSTLRNRHQTLEDLRSDLRARSALLNRELLDLVNGHYEEFLTLGEDLKGGGEKVEGVRVGLLGFEREVEGVRRVVDERVAEVKGLVGERRRVWGEISLGRGLVEVGRGVGELEERVGLVKKDVEGEAEQSDQDDEEDDELDGVEDGMGAIGGTVRRLKRHVLQFLLLSRSIARLGAEHPYLLSLRPRMDELRRTLLLDLGAALKQATSSKAHDAILPLVRMYADLGAEQEGVKALKGG